MLSIEADVAYTFEECQALLRIGKNVLRRLIKTGELGAKKVGRRKYRILGSEILSYLGRTSGQDGN